MKKELITSIIVTVLLVILAVIGSTYAFYSLSATGSNHGVSTNSKKFEIVYNGGTAISTSNCPMNLTTSKDGGCSTTIQIGLASGVDVAVNASIYIKVNTITDNLKIAGFKWELYSVNGQTETLVANGNFASIPANNTIVMASNQALSTTLKTYKVYFWIDGSLANNSVYPSSFGGSVGAYTDQLTGIVNNS